MMGPTVRIEEVDGVQVVSFAKTAHGEVDPDAVRRFFTTEFLTCLRPDALVVIDLEGVAVLDSSSLGPLIQRLRESRIQGGNLILCHVDQPTLREVFTRTRFDRLFPIRATRPEAVVLARSRI